MSLSEVAQIAGVSLSTVSRYVKGQLKLSASTEQRVLEAIEEVGYRRPERESSGRVGLIVPDLENPYFAELAGAVSLAGASMGHHVLVSVSRANAARESLLVREHAKMAGLAGLFYVGMNPRNSALAKTANEMPVVMLDERVETGDPGTGPIPFVGADDYAGSFMATQFLIRQGHERIGHVAGPRELNSSKTRIRGYKAALEAHGLPFDESLVFSGPYSERFGASVLTYLTRLDPPITAVFVASDIVAVGLLATSSLYGVKVPDNLSVVGYDGIALANWLTPRLTTVRQPIRDIARTGYEQLAALIQGQATRSFELPMELEVRESTTPLATQAPVAGRVSPLLG